MPEDDLLILLAELSVALAGFSGVVVALQRRSEEPDPLASGRLWRLIETSLASGADSDRKRAYEASLQIGLLHVWREEPAEAALAYGDAMALDPWALNYNEVIGYVGLENFLGEVESVRAEIARTEGADSASLPLLDWWTGFAQFGLGRMPAAQQSFTAVIDGNPEFTSAWYYLFRSAYGHSGGVKRSGDDLPEEAARIYPKPNDGDLSILRAGLGEIRGGGI